MVLIFSMICASSVSISATVQNYVYNQKFENSNQNFGAEILEVIVDGQKNRVFSCQLWRIYGVLFLFRW